ncbi:hybrid sensor histidine kinase/response regulator [Methylomonas sp. AM2-LC]|uniref:hybrid sensor histidine kinase/response regulator n=1 Tax=Methylomonas sp. AM2-LC TaxID=3153301 RepID=UPI0032637AE0
MPNSNSSVCIQMLRKLIWTIQPCFQALPLHNGSLSFDTEHEKLFWQERRSEALSSLKFALAIGSIGFLTFIGLDILNNTLSTPKLFARLAIVISFGSLLKLLYQRPLQKICISKITKLAITAYIFSLIGIMLSETDSLLFNVLWTGLIPIYFLIYGQMLMTLSETVLFGWIAMLTLPISAYLIDFTVSQVMPSVLLLVMANFFGFCTRYQLERQTRLAYQAKCKAEIGLLEKTEFTQQLSHNLRQPLQALSSYSSLLETLCCDRSDYQLQHIATRLGHTTDELINTFNQILTIGNLENGKQQPLLKAVDLNLLLADMSDQFTPQAAKRHLKLKINLRTKPPFNVYSDACILKQIISNLLDNAIKYTQNGWIIVSTVKTSNQQIKLIIRDTGIGISEDDKPKIFNECYRGTRRLNDPCGNGIGLSYVQKALNILPGHSLSLHSKVNQGSRFQIQLPVAKHTNPEKPIYSPLPACNYFVLIVDDNKEVLSALAAQLNKRGCLVQTATCIEETLIKLSENEIVPDLLITDFYLENNQTAHDIIAAVSKHCGSLPSIILSAHPIPYIDKQKFPEHTLLLRKPVNNTLLFEKISETLSVSNSTTLQSSANA